MRGDSTDGGARSVDARGVLKQLWELFQPYRWQVLGLSLLVSFSSALATISPQFVRIALDQVIPSGQLQQFFYLATLIALFYLFDAAVTYAGMFYSYAFTQKVISDIRMRAYSRLLKLPMMRFTQERSGSLVSRVVSDVNALEQMIQAGSTRLLGQLFSILVVITILFVMHPVLALVNLVIVPLLAFITWWFQEPLRQMSRRIRRRVGDMTAVASEAISNVQVVKSFANEPLETARFERENDTYVDLNLERRKHVGLMEGLITLTGEYGLAAVLLVGGWFVATGDLTIGTLTAFLLYQRMLQRPVQSVMMFNNQLQAGVAALERVADLLDAAPEAEGNRAERPAGRVELQDVTFRYPGTERLALERLSLKIQEGQTVAFVGPSGAGKTTITKLLSRLYDPESGRILLAGRDLREYTLEALRKAIAVVPQDPTLFSGSVRDNIRYAEPGASDAEVEQAARLANAHAFILTLPEGYDTEIGERGVKLSGGQKQRIAIARAILKNASILVLDEATSSLDSESEAVIQDALSGLFSERQGVTSIIIAHRLSTIQDADMIFVLDQARLVEAGSHGQLIRKNGLYRMLYDLQYRDDTIDAA
jgi:ABC-type multidrug transport system fused ATPase/permease subunit